jgi:hypothetical protein
MSMHLVGYIVISVVILGCMVVCGMKGKLGFVALGVFLPVLWIIGAVRPAKPNSFWARRVYDDFPNARDTGQ